MKYEEIKEQLVKKHSEVNVTNYINYLRRIETEKNSKKEIVNTWFKYMTEKKCIDLYNKVANEGLVIDGEIVTILSRGLSYGYHAYKNILLIKYPETLFDIQLVREGDNFEFKKEDGKVSYTHILNSPFNEKQIIGGYCVIKNRLGHFLETISLAELTKIRKTAKTDYMWAKWTSEMYLKTIIKRACKRHFRDIVANIDKEDNENYDVKNPLDISIEIKQEIEKITTLEELKKYYEDKKDTVEQRQSFLKLLSKQKAVIKNENI